LGMRPIESVKGELLACTFCAFCRRSCPVYRATLWEGESPRGRVAQGYGLLMDELEPTDEFYDSILNCSLCGLCEDACPPKIRVVDVVLAARRHLAQAGAKPPERVAHLLRASLEGKILIPRAEVVYLPGREGEDALNILRALGVRVEPASAPPLSPLMIAGSPEFEDRLAELSKALKAAGARRVITSDPDELWALRERLKDVEVLHASQAIPLDGVTGALEREAAYLPSCRLRRLGVSAADDIIRSILNVKKELECAGSEDGWLRDDALSRIVRERVEAADDTVIVCASAEHARTLKQAGAEAMSIWEAIKPVS